MMGLREPYVALSPLGGSRILQVLDSTRDISLLRRPNDAAPCDRQLVRDWRCCGAVVWRTWIRGVAGRSGGQRGLKPAQAKRR